MAELRKVHADHGGLSAAHAPILAEILADAEWKRLEIDMSHNRLGDGLPALSAILRNTREFDIGHNDLGDAAVRRLLASLGETRIEVLCLENNAITGADDVFAPLVGLQHSRLMILRLVGNPIAGRACRALAECIDTVPLRRITLDPVPKQALQNYVRVRLGDPSVSTATIQAWRLEAPKITHYDVDFYLPDEENKRAFEAFAERRECGLMRYFTASKEFVATL